MAPQDRIEECITVSRQGLHALETAGMNHLSDLSRKTIAEVWQTVGIKFRFGTLFDDLVDLMVKRGIKFADGSPVELKRSKSVRELGLNTGTQNLLVRSDITTIYLLTHLSEVDLLEIRNLGKGKIDEIKQALAKRKLKLRAR